MNNPVTTFIEAFESAFSGLLLHPPRTKPATYTEYFTIKGDKFKTDYSDWDIECWLQPEAVTSANLQRIDTFIRTYPHVKSVGQLLPTADCYLFMKPHHIRTSEKQHYMAVMDGLTPPFVDIQVRGVNGEALLAAFPGEHDDEFENWIRITAWRKLRISQLKYDDEEYENFITAHVRPFYEHDNALLRADPAAFYEKHIDTKKYAAAVQLLRTDT